MSEFGSSPQQETRNEKPETPHHSSAPDPRRLERGFILIYFWNYWLQSIHATWLNLSLRLRGFTGTSIGLLGAVAAITGVIVAPLVGVTFDRSNRRPHFLAALVVICAIAFPMYSFMPGLALMIPVAILLSVGWLSLVPLIDATAMSQTVREASNRGFGGYRRWGAIGFATAGVVVGVLEERFGIGIIFAAYVLCAFIVAGLVWRIPREACPPGDKSLVLSDIFELLRLQNFRRFLSFTLLASIGGSGCFAFRVIHLNAIGVPGTAIGSMWVLPILAEVACFTLARSIVSRWGTAAPILVGRILGAARWWLLSAVTYLPLLFVTEILHGLSFAIFYPAAITFVQNEVPARLRGTAQVLFFSSTMGLGSAIGTFIAGQIYDEAGIIPILWGGGAIVAVAGVLQVLFVKHIPPARTMRTEIPTDKD